MTESGKPPGEDSPPPVIIKRRQRRCRKAMAVTLLVLLLLIAIALILFFALLKPKDPQTTLVSAKVDGVAPRVTFPTIHIELNVTLDLEILVRNPNRASFKHGQGQSSVYYRGNQVGDADLTPGRIRARGSEVVRCRLTIEADKFVDDVDHLIGDVMNGEVGIDTSTRIPGRVTFLGIFRRHAVAVSECHVAIGFPDLKIRRQECTHKTKL